MTQKKLYYKEFGFTLLELIISILIIGILVTTSFSGYTDYISRTQAIAALSEIQPATIYIDLKILSGLHTELSGSNASLAKDIGLSSSETSRCSTIYISISTSGTATVSCTIKGAYKINGKIIQLYRTESNSLNTYTGIWECNTNISGHIKPNNCNIKDDL